MNVDMKVGQLFLLAYPGKNPEKIQPLVDQFGIAGCYISQDNAETFTEAREVSEQLQNMASQTPHALPMILGIDQEGAWGVLVPESTSGPGNLALTANTDSSIAEKMYQVIGEHMLSVGYNTILAPCADVNSDPDSPIIDTRSFGDDPKRVSELLRYAVRGIKKTGALSTLKHFPGHGATGDDTHRNIPEVHKTLSELFETDLAPFAAGIDEGADIVMTAHIRYPRIDSENPATLSRIILEDILRKKLGFNGVILSDSMNMGAIRRFYEPGESTVMALKAGVDIVMLSEEHYDHDENYLEKQLRSLRKVKDAILQGSLPMKEVDAKLRRIISMKMNKMKAAPVSMSLSESEAAEIESRAAAGACTVIRDDWNLLPANLREGSVCVNATPRDAYSCLMNSRGIGPNQMLPAYDSFHDTLASLCPAMKFMEYDEAQKRSDELNDARIVLLITENYPLPGEDMEKKRQQSFVRKCLEKYRQKIIVVGLRSPYEIRKYPGKITYVSAYSSRTCAAVAAARLLASMKSLRGVHHLQFS